MYHSELAKTESGSVVIFFMLTSYMDEECRFQIAVSVSNAGYQKGSVRNFVELATMDEILDLLERPVHVHGRRSNENSAGSDDPE